MDICVIGLGYVGLVTGAVLADLGNEVIGADIDQNKIEQLTQGIMPFYEPGLKELVQRGMKEGRLVFTTETPCAVQHAEIIFITVGTPPCDNGETDLSFIRQAAATIGQAMNGPKIVVTKSTVPVGSGDLVRRLIEANQTSSTPFEVVSNPEFLREGSAIYDSLYPDRIIIGADNQEAAMRLVELYLPLQSHVLITSLESAEMIKYASNAFLAAKISFINTIANLCELVGADVRDVAKGMGLDRRIGPEFLNAGLGFGGSCFPKDTESLIHVARSKGYDFALLRAVSQVNREQPQRFASRIVTAMQGVQDKTIGILGLAFKPNTDDLREASSLTIIRYLLDAGAQIQAFDPVAIDNCRQFFPDLTYCTNAYEAAADADGLVIVTDWNEFKLLNLQRIKDTMRHPLIFDGRNIYDPKKMQRLGIKYIYVGH